MTSADRVYFYAVFHVDADGRAVRTPHLHTKREHAERAYTDEAARLTAGELPPAVVEVLLYDGLRRAPLASTLWP